MVSISFLFSFGDSWKNLFFGKIGKMEMEKKKEREKKSNCKVVFFFI